MAEMQELHRRAGEILVDALRLAPGASWSRPTPCEDWDLRALVHHVVWNNLWVAPLMHGASLDEAAAKVPEDPLGDDPVGAAIASVDEASAAFGEAGAMDRTVALSRGPSPGRVYCAERMNDLTVHAWDLARALGTDVALDAACMEAAMAYYRPFEPVLRPAGEMGPDVPVPEDSDLQTRFLAFWGRRADWSPPT
jgi:uncharacterized protein (TIGR03086 family)